MATATFQELFLELLMPDEEREEELLERKNWIGSGFSNVKWLVPKRGVERCTTGPGGRSDDKHSIASFWADNQQMGKSLIVK
jgi:hypothetical protein